VAMSSSPQPRALAARWSLRTPCSGQAMSMQAAIAEHSINPEAGSDPIPTLHLWSQSSCEQQRAWWCSRLLKGKRRNSSRQRGMRPAPMSVRSAVSSLTRTSAATVSTAFSREEPSGGLSTPNGVSCQKKQTSTLLIEDIRKVLYVYLKVLCIY